MSQAISGNIKGLAHSEIKRVERLFHRRLDAEELVSLDLARELFRLASELRRRIGLLVSREGRVEEVILGTKEIIYLPDLGRYRLGRGRLRRLRLLFSDLSSHPQATIPHDIYADIEKLRLDAVVAIREHSNRVELRYAHLIPGDAGSEHGTMTHLVEDLGRFDLDFGQFMDELEAELAAQKKIAREPGETLALLVGVYEPGSARAPEESMLELSELARTAKVKVVEKVIQRRLPDPKTLLGKGKLEEVMLRCLRLGAEMIIFDTSLKPTQWRIITNSTELKIIDRSMLILDIFAQRASSSEGRLQVELAQLKYNLPRLVEKDAGLSRLSGGIGGRGPGETKLEIGRRRIRERIADLEKRIDRLSDQRHLRRQRRVGQTLPTVAILGYTNVGKSTLFNALTKSEVLAENKLFATLDPAQRKMVLPPTEENPTPLALILSDTVGFIHDLPNELKSAFRATLEELHEADLFLHVVDAADPHLEEKMQAVNRIIQEMKLADTPSVVIVNKVDKVDALAATQLARGVEGLAVSATTRQGFDTLRAKLRQLLQTKIAASMILPEESEEFPHLEPPLRGQ
jgi:GTPase